MRRRRRSSLADERRFQNGTPSGELSLRYTSRSVAAGQLVQVRLVDVRHLRHEQKGRTPARAVDVVVLQEELVLGGGSDSPLRRDAQFVGRVDPRPAQGGQGPVVDIVEHLDQFPPVLLELLQDRPHQVPVGGEGVAAAVEPRFDAVFGNPQTALRQVLALDHRGAEVAHLEDDLFPELAASVREEIGEPGEIGVEVGIHARGEDDRGSEGTVGVAPQRRNRGARFGRELPAGAVPVAVDPGHDVHVDLARHRATPKLILHPGLLDRVVGGQHVAVGPLQRGFRQQFVVAGDLRAFLEGGALELLRLAPDQAIDEVQVGGDPPGARILVPVGDLLVGFILPVAVEHPHLLDEGVVHERDHG